MKQVGYLVNQLDGVAQSLSGFEDLSDYERAYEIGALLYLVGELKKEVAKQEEKEEEND